MIVCIRTGLHAIYLTIKKTLTMKKEFQFSEVIQLIKQARANAYKAINVELINCYWQVGEYISRRIADASWGDRTVKDLAQFIQKGHPGDNELIKFVSPVVSQLSDIRKSILARISWTHHLIIFSRTKTEEEREFYIRLCIRENYSKRELDRQISSGVFERVVLRNQQLPAALRQSKKDISTLFKSDYVFEFLCLPKDHNESDLQKALISQMKDFILELGRDFLFIGEEYRIQVGNSDFKADLLFYHRGLQ
jgi:predicted nuclease of restriction endonuclease-like (RecB) superfamily